MKELQDLLYTTQTQNASDLHLAAGQFPILRVFGEIQPISGTEKLDAEKIKQMILSTMTEPQRQEFEEKHELDYAINFDKQTRFRVNAYETLNGASVAFRRIENNIKTFDDLGLPSIMKSLCGLRKGLILVTGPTGSGKSSTLAAMVNHINVHYRKHIITIEDPIEFVHESKSSLINQREIHKHCRSFADALRNALREDPDVILVGELRDLETVSLAMSAAETGHLVLATLHTSSAPKSIDRIIDIFPDGNKALARTMLASSLQAVITQLLAPTTDGKGRVPALEIMIANSAIRNLIRENHIAQIYSNMEVNKKLGMVTLNDSVEQLLAKQLIDMKQAKLLLNELTFDVSSASANKPAPKAEPISLTPHNPAPISSAVRTDPEQF